MIIPIVIANWNFHSSIREMAFSLRQLCLLAQPLKLWVLSVYFNRLVSASILVTDNKYGIGKILEPDV